MNVLRIFAVLALLVACSRARLCCGQPQLFLNTVPRASSGGGYTPPHVVQWATAFYNNGSPVSLQFTNAVTAGDTIIVFTGTEATVTGVNGEAFSLLASIIGGGQTYSSSWMATNVAAGTPTITLSPGNVVAPGFTAVELSPCSTNVIATQAGGLNPLTATLPTTTECIVLAYWVNEKANGVGSTSTCNGVATNTFASDGGLFSGSFWWQGGFAAGTYLATLSDSQPTFSCWTAVALH